jgi:hypothetical protein
MICAFRRTSVVRTHTTLVERRCGQVSACTKLCYFRVDRFDAEISNPHENPRLGASTMARAAGRRNPANPAILAGASGGLSSVRAQSPLGVASSPGQPTRRAIQNDKVLNCSCNAQRYTRALAGFIRDAATSLRLSRCGRSPVPPTRRSGTFRCL